MFNKTKKILSYALAACSVFACATTLTACETNKPEVQMKIAFNGKTYTLDYTMKRKVSPRTVEHFLWLVDGGFYNNTIIHDYDASDLRMYGGSYGYIAEDDRENASVYYEEDKSYKAFCEKYKKSFPASVFKDSAGKTATYTLYGEFEDNKFEVTNGDLSETFGSLTMYYHAKTTDQTVYVKRADSKNKYAERGYEYNSATTMFYISLKTSSPDNQEYCTFATLDKDSVSVLKNLQEAINDYIEEKYDSEKDDFITKTIMHVDKEDEFVSGQDKTVTFNLPNEPIVIKSVKVTKY